MQVIQVPLSRLHPDPANRRAERVDELADSIARVGLLQNIVARPFEGDWRVVAGHRRREAVIRLRWEEVACAVVDTDEVELLRAVENTTREALTLAQQCDQTAELRKRYQSRDLAVALGYSVSQVNNLARIREQLCPEAWKVLQAEGHKAKLKWWLEMAGRPVYVQKQRLFGAEPVRSTDERKSRPSLKLVRAKRAEIPDSDPRAEAIDWVLGVRESLSA